MSAHFEQSFRQLLTILSDLNVINMTQICFRNDLLFWKFDFVVDVLTFEAPRKSLAVLIRTTNYRRKGSTYVRSEIESVNSFTFTPRRKY